LFRGPADGRSDEPADAEDDGAVRQAASGTEWRADSDGGALEIRLQEREVDCEDRVRRQGTADILEQDQALRVRILLERESKEAASTLVPSDREVDSEHG